MSEPKSKRIMIAMTPEQQRRIKEQQELIAQELPQLLVRGKLSETARRAPTLSGALRRAIHGSGMTVVTIADRVGITSLLLDQFLTGEQTLPSDVMDKLAALLGCEIKQAS